jgi:hypothetical protein
MSDALSCVILYYIGYPESKDTKAIKFLEVFVNKMEWRNSLTQTFSYFST